MIEIAIICSTFNRSKQLSRHLWTLAHQDYPLDECVFIIVDDGSVDDTQQTIDTFFEAHPHLKFVNLLTNRKSNNYFGGHGIVLNLGLRYAEELGAEYVFLTGGDILWPSYALRKHMAVHQNSGKRAEIIVEHLEFITSSESDRAKSTHYYPELETKTEQEIRELVYSTGVDVMIGPKIRWIRPDHQSLGNNINELAAIPDRYDWRPPEKLINQPEAFRLEPFPDGGHIHLGYTDEIPSSDRYHTTAPDLLSCKLKYWLDFGGWDESGTGHFYEDFQLVQRLHKYIKYRIDNKVYPLFLPIVHPSVECYHQPHPRQLSHCNHRIFMDNVEKCGYDVNKGQGLDWGKCPHEVRNIKIRS